MAGELRTGFLRAGMGELAKPSGERGFDDIPVAKSTMIALTKADPEQTWRAYDLKVTALDIDLTRQLKGELIREGDENYPVDGAAYGLGLGELIDEGLLIQRPTDELIQFAN